MDRFNFDEIAAGNDGGCLWVSVGFVSEDNPYDVLHIVVATQVGDDDRDLRHDTVYLERSDQSMSCYGGSSKIEVGKDFVKVYLTPKGKDELGFGHSLHFDGLARVQGHADARHIFREMAGTECGALVSVCDDA